MSIGIYQRGVRRIFTYGAAAPDSIFPIASLTKPFTGLVLAAMVEEGTVRLERAGAAVDSGGAPAAAFRRGNHACSTWRRIVPACPGCPRTSTRPNRANPYAGFDAARLRNAFLARRGPGKESLIGAHINRTTISASACWAMRSALVPAWTTERSFTTSSRDRWRCTTRSRFRHPNNDAPPVAGIRRRAAARSGVGRRRPGGCRRAQPFHRARHADMAGSPSSPGDPS